MHVHFEIRLSRPVALLCLASVSLCACDDTVRAGESCAAECEDGNSKGVEQFNAVNSTCACSGCSEACSENVCNKDQTPSDTCLPCVQNALQSDKCQVGLFTTGCNGHAECRAFVDCLLACPTE
jgi:hypothetical protein